MFEQIFGGRSRSTKIGRFSKIIKEFIYERSNKSPKIGKIAKFFKVASPSSPAGSPASQPASQPASSLQRAFQRGRQLWLVCSGWLALGGHTET